MKILKIMLPLIALLIGSAAARAQEEEGVKFTLTTRCIPSDAASSMTQTALHAADESVYLSVSGKSGFSFIRWEDEAGNEVSTSRSFYYTMPAGDVTIIARFEYNPTSPAEPNVPEVKKMATVRLDMNPAEACRSISAGGQSFYEPSETQCEVGSTVSFSAYAKTGFRFVNWIKDGEEISTSSSIRYLVEEGVQTLVANFIYDPSNPTEPGELKFYRKLTLNSNPEEAVSSFSGAGEHLSGSSFTVSASPKPYYVFENWTDEQGEILSEDLSFSYTMPNRHTTLTANFHYDFNPSNPSEPGSPESDDDGIVRPPRMTMKDDTHVVILCSTPGATIYYTTDGTDPTTSSNKYEDAVFVPGNIIVKAIAVKEGMTDSPVTTYRVSSYRAALPTIVFENMKIQITTTTENATIHFTTDNSDPTADSPVYTGPFLPEEDILIKAIACRDDLVDSDIAVFVYERDKFVFDLPTPTAAYGRHALTLACDEEGSEIHYTLDGTTPTSEYALYSAPIPMTEDCTVRFFATKTGYNDSEEASYTFTLSDWQETLPSVIKDLRNRRIHMQCESEAGIRVLIDGTPQILAARDSIDVVPAMKRIEVTSIATDEDRYDSPAVAEELIFHLAPKLDYDGHAVHYSPDEDDPYGESSEGWFYVNGELRRYGSSSGAMEMLELCSVAVHIESDLAFRSEDLEMQIDFFNTGRVAAARNGHRLSEAFGQWGDQPDDYAYLRIKGGEVAAEDLGFIATLSNLTTLHLSPSVMEEGSFDGVLAGTRIETIFSYSYPEGMLKGMERLTTVMWGVTNTRMPSGRLSEAGNPNVMLWLTDKANAPEDAVNVVEYDYVGEGFPTDPEGTGIIGRADRISLQAGYPFGVHMPVDAAGISLAKEFRLPTEIGESAGWETLTVPFDVETISHEAAGEIKPFSLWMGREDAAKPFWLYCASDTASTGWKEATAVKAGIPYIISMPNNADYVDGYNLQGKVTFAASGVSLTPEGTQPKETDWLDGMTFAGTFMPVEETGIRSLNVSNAAGREWLGSAFVDEDETLPFGAYMRGEGMPRQIPVFGDLSGVMTPSAETGGIMVESPAPGTIRVSSTRDCRVAVATPDGATVRVLSLRAGESVTADGLTRGLYIAAGVKVMVR